MKAIFSSLRFAAECLLVLPLLPVIGLMWVAWAATSDPPDDPTIPARLPPPKPRPAPAAERKRLPRYVKRQWRERRQRLLSRLLGHGDFVTEWQMR